MLRIDHDDIYHLWPSELTLDVNGKEIFRVRPPEQGHKRRDVPQDITSSLKQGVNTITVQMSDGGPLTDFAIAVALATPRRVKQLCAKVDRCEEEAARARFRSILAEEQDTSGAEEGVQYLSSGALKLICPITMDRIAVPARGRECAHLQCFGLWAYCKTNFSMSAFNNRWACPVCGKRLRPSELCVDSFMERILAETPESIESVTLALDGSWSCTPATKMASVGAVDEHASSCRPGRHIP